MNKSIYLDVSTPEKFLKVAPLLTRAGYTFPAAGDLNITAYNSARAYYHGNSKLLLSLFFNNITNRLECQFTTRTIEKSYPNAALNIYSLD